MQMRYIHPILGDNIAYPGQNVSQAPREFMFLS